MRSAVRSESYGSVTVFSLNEKVIEAALAKWLTEVRKRPEVLAVVLFGSFVSGREVPGSDLDLLIVLRDDLRPFLDRIPDCMPDGIPVPVDVFPYAQPEIEAGQPVASEALRTGQVLWRRGAVDEAGGAPTLGERGDDVLDNISVV